MSYRHKFLLLKVSILVFALLVNFGQPAIVAEELKKADDSMYEQIELFSHAISIVRSDYVDEVEAKKLIYGALDGLLSSLDGYSQFMDPDSFKEMEIDTRGQFGGLGVEIGIRDGVLTVISPIDGTPAEKAGVKGGDKIVKINGGLTRGIKLNEAVKKLRGQPGTNVTLSVWREGTDKLLEFVITRSIIKLESIKTAELLEDGIAYIKLIEFQQNTAKELESKLSDLSSSGMKGLILDLRNNPGGLLDVSYKVADKFLPAGKTVVTLKGRVKDQNKEYKSTGASSFTGFPMVVLVNEGSASASEIVAGAIQDNKRGITLGVKTFGKGSVQTVIPLRDGSAVRLTTAAYYTPSGRSIKDKGLIPDIEVRLRTASEDANNKVDVFDKVDTEEPEEKKPAQKSYDNQMQAALDMLRGILFYKSNLGS